MEQTYSNYLKTNDEEQIFYTTNFDPKTLSEQEEVLFFNYGLVCSNYHWSKQIDYFDAAGFKILMHDYRGHFHSTGETDLEKITFKQITKDMYDLCSQLDIKKTVLFGHSMGVNVCLEFTKNYPELVSKQILISGTTVPLYNVMFNTNLMDQVKPFLSKMLKKHPGALDKIWKMGGWNPIVKKLVHLGGFNIKEVSKEFIEVYLNKVGQLGPEIFFQLMEEMNKHDILGSLNNIKAKTLVIGGDKDNVIPNYLQKQLNNHLPNSELYIVKNGSHVPQVDFPKFINERILFFLNN